jgi:hypothetical protein
MELLPPDILRSILSYLSHVQLCEICTLHSRLLYAAQDEQLWKHVNLETDKEKINDDFFIRAIIPKMARYTENLSLAKCKHLTKRSFEAMQIMSKVRLE